MNLISMHSRACLLFGAQLQHAHAEDWDRRTPCADWDVRALAAHVVGENLWTPPLLAGRSIEEVGSVFDGDVCGADPASAFQRAAGAAMAAVGSPGALTRTVHLSFGDVSGTEYVGQLFVDHLVHAWDLARALDGDEHLPADLVVAAADWFGEREQAYRAAGAVGPRVPVVKAAGPQVRLLAAFGRGDEVVTRA